MNGLIQKSNFRKIILFVSVLILLTVIFLVWGNINAKPAYLLLKPTIKNNLDSYLTSGSWTKTLGSGAFSESYKYRFSSDGTYSSQLYSDYSPAPETGNWTTINEENRTKLILKSNKSDGSCYWLPCESYIEYDSLGDKLLVSGPTIVETQQLQHSK